MIALRDIDKDNWVKCVMLNPDKNEQVSVVTKFVDSVAYSMVWAQMEEGIITKAICNDEEIIGFTMYGRCEEVQGIKIYSILIDSKHQRMGYGRKVLNLILDEINKMGSVKKVYLTFNPENIKGKALYESIGFENTGLRVRLPAEVIKEIYGENYKVENDEFLYCLKL
ncbi:N-acetyltransferase [Clostridium sp. CF012]|uniref:GNAT family N-acetyltransferase n=1 Tax=Clostridium sp. CF012 TaxID=2843319 RepID=UPI001C0E2BDD|nr:N-acetyltransferase [Clostridium sp. CF012]MBU3145173.1 GNAT family N-acetyltransferase [Clostridium sp. CF012]